MKKDFKNANFVFDMDGTLIDKKGQIKPGVADFFVDIITKGENATITIATGSRPDQVKRTYTRICRWIARKYPMEVVKECIDKIKNANYISYAGSLIKEGGKPAKKYFLPSDFCYEVQDFVRQVDPDALIIARTPDGDVNVVHNKRKIKYFHNVVKYVSSQYGVESKDIPAEKFNQYMKDGLIYSFEIVGLANHKKLYDKLCQNFNRDDISMTCGVAVEISSKGKLKAMEELFEGNLNNVIYFGDGPNDLVPFQNVGCSFGVGKNFDVLKSATFAIADYSEASNYIFGDVSEEQMRNMSNDRLEVISKNPRNGSGGIIGALRDKYSHMKNMEEFKKDYCLENCK